MCIAHDDPQPGSTATSQAPGPPATRPVLPVVRFSEQKPRIQVYRALELAYEAAQQAPYDLFFDVRGFRMEAGEWEPGIPSLVAVGEATPGELQERIMAELRAAAELEYPDGFSGDPIEGVLGWLAASPSPQLTVEALGLHPVVYDNERNIVYSWTCTSCTKLQKLLGKPGCCP